MTETGLQFATMARVTERLTCPRVLVLCWRQRCELPHPVCAMLGVEPRRWVYAEPASRAPSVFINGFLLALSDKLTYLTLHYFPNGWPALALCVLHGLVFTTLLVQSFSPVPGPRQWIEIDPPGSLLVLYLHSIGMNTPKSAPLPLSPQLSNNQWLPTVGHLCSSPRGATRDFLCPDPTCPTHLCPSRMGRQSFSRYAPFIPLLALWCPLPQKPPFLLASLQ